MIVRLQTHMEKEAFTNWKICNMNYIGQTGKTIKTNLGNTTKYNGKLFVTLAPQN